MGLADFSARGEVADAKLKKVTEESEEIEAAREEMEAKEQEADERVEELETSVKDMQRTLELNTVRNSDGERKVKVCENDISKNREKAEGYEARVAALEEAIENHGKRLEELGESEGAAGEREALNEEKVDFLTAQLKETEVRADAAERMNAVYTNTMVETETEIGGWVKKTQDMEDLMVLMDNLADDPNYDLSKGGRRVSTTASAKDMWGAKDAVAEAESRSSSRASSRGGQLTRAPKDPTPEPEEESEEEEEEEEEEAPPPAPEPEEEEESEEEESEEEESDEE